MKADAQIVVPLLKTARGQLDAILRMVEEDKYCLDISHQLMSCEAIVKKANREILRAHMESCVREAFESGSPEESQKKVDELVELLARLSK